jgi:MoaA/NifB/PqqE/SkfB family radical SAM enzyme
MGVANRIKRLATVQAARMVLKILPRISEQNLLQFPVVRKGLKSPMISKYPEGKEFFKSLLIHGRRAMARCSKPCLDKLARNLIVNEFIAASSQREKFHTRFGFDPPFFIVLSPTMRCNLACYGCYAGQYEKDEELDSGLIHRVLREAQDLGVYFLTLSGGEPFIRPDLLDIIAAHGDQYFQVYTNGTLIDRKMAKTLSRLGNVLPAISVEGWEKETDTRRGTGAFRKILETMSILREEGVLFGFSATATRQNSEVIISDAFVDFWARQGCFIGWFFNYVPIGKNPNLDLMPTPEQRIHRRRRLTELRPRVPLILVDFWNDGPLVGGCIAGDRYLHINNRGDVEPCVFIHFSVDNIREKSLSEILDSEFFHAFRRRQPYSPNFYRPCTIIDHPHILRRVVEQTGARPTHYGAESLVRDCSAGLDRYAAAYGELADKLWKEQFPSTPIPSAKGREQDRVPMPAGRDPAKIL